MDFCLLGINFTGTIKCSYRFFMVLQVCKCYSLLVQHVGIMGSNLQRDVVCHYGFIIHSNTGKCPSFVEECRYITRLDVK